MREEAGFTLWFLERGVRSSAVVASRTGFCNAGPQEGEVGSSSACGRYMRPESV